MRITPDTSGPAVLLVGESRDAEAALRTAHPGALVRSVPDWFAAIATLRGEGPGSPPSVDAIVGPIGPIAPRAEAALGHVRRMLGAGRIILTTDADGEILSRKLLGRSCDEYLVWPVAPSDWAGVLREPAGPPASPRTSAIPGVPESPPAGRSAAGVPVAEILLDAFARDPATGIRAALDQLSRQLPVGSRLTLLDAAEGTRAPFTPVGMQAWSRPVGAAHILWLTAPAPHRGDHVLADIVPHLERALALHERIAGMQKLAITDDLTGIYNGRYFKHALDRILDRARQRYLPVTLLLFDIDGFKKYNDNFGHAAGDEILRQTAAMMKRCIRDHDVVARLGGDEFAVVFWDNEAPRPNAKPGTTPNAGRPPHSPAHVFERFRGLIESHDFQALGASGKGQLTISGGLAVYPYDAADAESLIEAADKALMFGAKKSGKNMLHLVGDTGVHKPSRE